MKELSIKQNYSDYNRHLILLTLILFIFVFFVGFLPLFAQNHSPLPIKLCLIGSVLILFFSRHIYIYNQREILISKIEKSVTVSEIKFFGKKISHFSLDSFTSVRSYIDPTKANGNGINYVDLLHSDGKSSLMLASFPTYSTDRFFSHDWEEYKDAKLLRDALGELTELNDLGFLEAKWRFFPQIQ
jgi:hypothetical protein